MKHWMITTYLILALFVVALGLLIACGDDDDDDDSSSNDDDDDDNDTTGGEDDDDDLTNEEVWSDTVSGLMWQRDVESDMIWEDSITYCQNLVLSGFENWRVPNISELRSLIRGCEGTEIDGDCAVTVECLGEGCMNNACYGCPEIDGPADNGAFWPPELYGDPGYYWTSNTVSYEPGYAWFVDFESGSLTGIGILAKQYIRCVRTPQ